MIKNVKVPNGYMLISLDATSLYTNVHQDMCIAAIERRWNMIENHTFLTKNQFIDAIKLITTESYFRYKDHYYLQKTGLAMGNSISGLLADMVMNDLETKTLKNLPFIVTFYKRYVDDIIAVIPQREAQKMLDEFNNYDQVHKKLQFTKEEECNRSINFLDMTLTIDNNGYIRSKWYQKAISSGRYLNFQASNPTTHKRNVVTALTDRAIAFTDPENRKESLDKVRNLLDDNGYPQDFVQNIIKERVKRFYNGNTNDEKEKMRRIPAPYVPGLSERINKNLREYNMTLASKSYNNIGKLYTRTKYKIPKEEKSKVIYKIECECDREYIGNTKQLTKKRFSRHRSDIKLKKTTETTGLSVHAVQTKHKFDFENFTILDHIPKYHQRSIAEKMHIVNSKNAVNLTIDTAGLHPSYVTFFKNQHPPNNKVKIQTNQPNQHTQHPLNRPRAP